MNKVLQFYVKHEDTLIYYYTDLNCERQKYDIQLNQLLTQFVGTNRTELKVVVEWIVKQINQEDAEEAVDLFLQEFV